MEKQFVTYDIAKTLKELGFNEPCFGFYDDTRELNCGFSGSKGYIYSTFTHNVRKTIVIAPLWQQVIDWLREKHYIDIKVYIKSVSNGDIPIYEFSIYFFAEHPDKKWYNESLDYNSQGNCGTGNSFKYLDVREQAILKAIEIIKEKI